MVTFGLLVLAGIGAGLSGSIAGLASLVSYPALLATGLSPVVANVTNTVALVFNSVGSVSGSRRDLVGQGARLRRLLPVGVVGGAVGGLLVLISSPDAFAKVVPVLIGLSSLGVLVQRRADPHADQHAPTADPWWLLPAVFGIGVYGGYFGPVAWTTVVPLAVGCLIGGRLGPVVVRRAPARLLRSLIAAAGVGLAVSLALDAYR